MGSVGPQQAFEQISVATVEPDPFAKPAPVVITPEELAMAQTSRFFGQIQPRPAPQHGSRRPF